PRLPDARRLAAEVRRHARCRRPGAAEGEAGDRGRGLLPHARPAPDADPVAVRRRPRSHAPGRLPVAGPGRAGGGAALHAGAGLTPMVATAPTEARLLEIVFPDHTNHLGTLFGGTALAWMDKAAFI